MQRFPNFGEIHLPSQVMNRLSPDNLNTFSWAGPLLPNFSRVMPFCIGPKSKSSFLDALRARSSSLRDLSISKSSILRQLSEYYWSIIVLSNMRAPDCFVLDLRRIASELNKRRRSASALGWPLAISAARITNYSAKWNIEVGIRSPGSS